MSTDLSPAQPQASTGRDDRGRVRPDFLIIGAQRSGTTSVFRYLSEHPQIRPSSWKEVHYFDKHWERGADWYRSWFPPEEELAGGLLTGEATPYLLFHPVSAERVRATLPDVRLIALLREPVARACSHYRHECRLGYESLSLPAAFAAEAERLASGEDWDERHYSYVSRGEYAGQLRRWFDLYPREQFFIVPSERLFADAAKVTNELAAWMGLEPFDLPEWPAHYGTEPGEQLEPSLAAELAAHFRPFNEELYELLGEDFGWG